MPTTTSQRGTIDYPQIWQYVENLPNYRRSYPGKILLFNCGNQYYAFGRDAVAIDYWMNQPEHNGTTISPPISEPLILDKSDLYRAIAALSETTFSFVIIDNQAHQ